MPVGEGRTIARLSDLPRRELPGGLVVLEATTRRRRGRGLARLDAADLPVDHALLLRPCRSVHTLGMRFAVDLVWLDAAGAVVGIDAHVRPRSIRTCLRARAVIETHAGRGHAFAAAGAAANA